MNIEKKICDDLVAYDVSFVTSIPCKQLAGVFVEVDQRDSNPYFSVIMKNGCIDLSSSFGFVQAQFQGEAELSIDGDSSVIANFGTLPIIGETKRC